jgi:hypothetical protein
MFLEILLGLTVAAIVLTALDVVYSEKSFAKGFVESNSIVHGLFGDKPSAVKLYVFHLAFIGGMFTLGLLSKNPGLMGVAVAGLVVAIFGHLQGFLQGRFLVNGGKIDPNAPKTAFQKIFGNWYW